MKQVLTVALLLALVSLVPCSASTTPEAPAVQAAATSGDTANPPASQDAARFLSLLRETPTLESVCGDCWAIGWMCCHPSSHPYCVNPADGEACGG